MISFMKLKFDPNQQYQLDAINAVVDIFRGQQNITNGVSIPGQLPLGIEGQQLSLETAGARGNNLLLSEDQVIRNTRLVQERNSILPAETAGRAIVTNHRSTDVVYGEKFLCGMNFSIEMETGTGKTYVYLRTIHELHQHYGWKKFIIVVPSVAIREGVLASAQAQQAQRAEPAGKARAAAQAAFTENEPAEDEYEATMPKKKAFPPKNHSGSCNKYNSSRNYYSF